MREALTGQERAKLKRGPRAFTGVDGDHGVTRMPEALAAKRSREGQELSREWGGQGFRAGFTPVPPKAVKTLRRHQDRLARSCPPSSGGPARSVPNSNILPDRTVPARAVRVSPSARGGPRSGRGADPTHHGAAGISTDFQ